MFLKLSVPILATLISSITNSYDQIGETTAATMAHPAAQNFEKYPLEFLGDTGAAHDIRSLRALQDQGLSRDMVEPWMKALQSPGGLQLEGGRNSPLRHCVCTPRNWVIFISISLRAAPWPYR